MFTRKYQLVKLEDFEEEEERISGNLPQVHCSALSASLYQDNNERENPVYFSSLSASILQEKRERTQKENEKKKLERISSGEKIKIHGRRRHNAEIQTPGKVEDVNPENLMEPLCSLVTSLSLNNEVEMRTLLEKDEDEKEEKEEKEKKTRKRTALCLTKLSQAASVNYSKVTFLINLTFF